MGVTSADFRTVSCQATVFTPDEEVSAAKLLRSFLPHTAAWLDLFDAEPTLLPMGGVAPRDVPRLILESQDGRWRCEVASSRINIVQRAIGVEPNLDRGGFYARAAELLAEYVEFLSARVGRLAALQSHVLPMSRPGSFLATRFCKPDWVSTGFSDVSSFELHSHSRTELDTQFAVNVWTRHKTAALSEAAPPEARAVVLVEQDINTLTEESDVRAFNRRQIDRFFSVSQSEFEARLRMYYPGE